MNTEHLTLEILEEMKKKPFMSLNAYRMLPMINLRAIMEALPEEAVLVGANLTNVRSLETNKEYAATPKSYISYVLNGYYVYIQLSDLWFFEGAMVRAELINKKGRVLKQTKYLKYIDAHNELAVKHLIELAKTPDILYDELESIPQSMIQEGSTPIVPTFYTN